MIQQIKCPVCTSLAQMTRLGPLESDLFYECPVCGRFEIDETDCFKDIDLNYLASYLFYHRFINNHGCIEYRFHTTLSKEKSDKKDINKYDNGYRRYGQPVYMDKGIIDNWYPKAFADRIDAILLYLENHIDHIGQHIVFSEQEMISLLFIDRKEIKYSLNTMKQYDDRNEQEYKDEAKYMLDFLQTSSYVEYQFGTSEDKALFIRLTPKGYSRVDELQKNTGYGKKVLVAMKFGEDTNKLRESIRKGITDSGYLAVFIDEVQHNEFITPELLKHIRDSKFIVADLTHENNGAYFEEGYAMGLGKPVIQLCKKGVQLHFDVAQKNTIIWSNEEEIPDRLMNRIAATID